MRTTYLSDRGTCTQDIEQKYTRERTESRWRLRQQVEDLEAKVEILLEQQKHDRPHVAKIAQEMKRVVAQNGEMLAMVKSLHVTWTHPTVNKPNNNQNKSNIENQNSFAFEEKLEERLLDKDCRQAKKDTKDVGCIAESKGFVERSEENCVGFCDKDSGCCSTTGIDYLTQNDEKEVEIQKLLEVIEQSEVEIAALKEALILLTNVEVPVKMNAEDKGEKVTRSVKSGNKTVASVGSQVDGTPLNIFLDSFQHKYNVQVHPNDIAIFV